MDDVTEDVPNRGALTDLFTADAFAGGLAARLTGWGGGWAEVAMTPREEHLNFGGVVHGGAVFGLGDYAFAVASNSWGRVAVALTVEVQYLRGVAPGTDLVARATERSRTRRTGAFLIEIHDDDRLVSSLHAMVFRQERWHLGADAWPDAWRDRY